jgi:ribosomal protein L5
LLPLLHPTLHPAAAVKVRLAGGAALDVLQKLAYLVLPSQSAFSVVSSKSLDSSGNLHFR